MKKLSLYIALLLIFITATAYAQKVEKVKYSFLVQKEVGDLNNDNYNDKVMVEMDLQDDTRPLRVQIFLSQPDRKHQLMVSSTKLIESQYPENKNGEHNGNVIPDFFIENGELKMLTDINNRKSSYEFRLKQKNFELIKISRVLWKGNDTTFESEIDLIAKTKIEFEQKAGIDKILNKKKKMIKINSLPKIQNLTFSELEGF